MTNNKIQIHVFISGKVQGVGYRYWTLTQAQKLGIKGWVKNIPDGRVEAVFLADQNIINDMIEKCYSGPSFSEVKEIITQEEIPQNFQDFKIIY